ncbi:MAG: cytochrome c [Gammaproteobacteria bacterium]|nr:cytochrome c [Gammaproteobacteria bacterium]
MLFRIMLPLCIAMLAVNVSTAAAPAKAPLCKACHGEKGNKPLMDGYPKLAGQNKGYLVQALKAYRDGLRQGGQSAVMTAQAKALSDEEIEALADYYAKQ